jgi:pteridine reductase
MPDVPVALITGAAQRLGAASARALHARGFHVVIHHHTSGEAASALAAELNHARAGSCGTACADLRSVAQCRELVDDTLQRQGSIDLLLNNASTFYPTPIESVNEAQWDELMASNLKAPLFLASAAAASLRTRRGCIINMTDIHADYPLREHPIYCAAKAGLASLTRSLARDLAPHVRVNAIAPGAILWPESGTDAERAAAIVANTELRRAGTEQDIAAAVCYFALDAPYVTGQILAVDGGRNLGP